MANVSDVSGSNPDFGLGAQGTIFRLPAEVVVNHIIPNLRDVQDLRNFGLTCRSTLTLFCEGSQSNDISKSNVAFKIYTLQVINKLRDLYLKQGFCGEVGPKGARTNIYDAVVPDGDITITMLRGRINIFVGRIAYEQLKWRAKSVKGFLLPFISIANNKVLLPRLEKYFDEKLFKDLKTELNKLPLNQQKDFLVKKVLKDYFLPFVTSFPHFGKKGEGLAKPLVDLLEGKNPLQASILIIKELEKWDKIERAESKVSIFVCFLLVIKEILLFSIMPLMDLMIGYCSWKLVALGVTFVLSSLSSFFIAYPALAVLFLLGVVCLTICIVVIVAMKANFVLRTAKKRIENSLGLDNISLHDKLMNFYRKYFAQRIYTKIA